MGYLFTTIYIIIIAYAIIKYQLMDINILIKKSIVYSALITAITIIFLIGIVTSEYIFRNIFGYQNLISSIIFAIIISVIFIPLRNKIQSFVDRTFFKGTPFEIAEQNELLRREVAEKEKFRTIATLASSLAHEIKTPLTVLNTFFDYFPQKRNDPNFVSRTAPLAQHELKRVQNLILQLLDFAKPSPPVFVWVEANKLVKSCLDLLENDSIKNKISFDKNLSSTDVNLCLDSNLIKQALLNLLVNAIDAMPNGGKLSVKTEVVTTNSEIFRISIEDTGLGIAPDDLNNIFKPFFTKKEKGTGLGLAITQEIIDKHGGKINVSSQVGKGTTFVIELPITKQ